VTIKLPFKNKDGDWAEALQTITSNRREAMEQSKAGWINENTVDGPTGKK
jgi:hypothetical protein